MKRLSIFLFAAILCREVGAATYYFSSSSGYYSNSLTPAKAQNPATPYRGNASTVDSAMDGKMGFTPVPGDVFMLKSGDSFYGTLTPTISGTAAAPIIVDTYGGTAKAKVTGMLSVTGWTSIGANLWESAATGVSTMPGVLFQDQTLQPLGRWPNETTSGNYGYLQYDSHTSTSITDADWGNITKPTEDWTGGQIAFRQNRFRFNVYDISQTISGASITFNLPENQVSTVDGFGYFIQNHVKALDKIGEWCYNKTTTKITIYSVDNPALHTITISAKDRGLDASGANYLEVRNLDIQGVNQYGIYKANGQNFTVNACKVTYAKITGVYLYAVAMAAVKSSVIDSSLTFGVQVYNFSGDSLTFTDNTISETMPIVGLNTTKGGQGTGLTIKGDGIYVKNNNIINSGYANIDAEDGSNMYIINNTLNGSCRKTSDGGSFYTNQQCYDNTNRNKVFQGNIILNSSLKSGGTSDRGTFSTQDLSMGIYLDQWSNHWTIKDNIIKEPRAGIYANSPADNSFTGNLIYGWTGSEAYGMELTSWKIIGGTTTYSFCGTGGTTYTNVPVQNNTSTGNIFFSTGTGSANAVYLSKTSTSGTEQPTGWGVFKNNYIIAPLAASTANVLKGQVGMPWATNSYTLSAWQTKMGYETGTLLSPKYITGTPPANPTDLIYNDSKDTKLISLGGFKWINHKGDSLNTNQVYLAPYTGMALIKTGTYTGQTSNTPPTVSVTAPVNNFTADEPATVTLKATAADADGTISKVEFYNTSGNTLIGAAVTAPPYQVVWNSIPAGVYSIKAVAYDNLNAQTSSGVVSITVNKIVVSTPTPINGTRFKTKYKKFNVK